MSETREDDEGEYGDPENDCFHCGGEGWQECRDPIQCTGQHNSLGECRCSSCGGSGLAKDQTIW
jgi:hypothetical protein